MPPLPQNLLLHVSVNIQFFFYIFHIIGIYTELLLCCVFLVGPLRGRVNFQPDNVLLTIPARHPDILNLLLRMVRAFL